MALTRPDTLGYTLVTGAVDLDTDTFYAMLLTSSYTPAVAHATRADLTNEVSGTGYTAGGQALTSVAVTRTGGTTKFTFAPVVWTTATLTARHIAVYKRRGGAASADELIGVDTFAADQSSSAGSWTYTPNAAGFLTVS